MKIAKYIYVLIFLAGMIFTVVKYIPLTEDLAQKTELSKKANENKDGSQPEDDTEGDSEGDTDNDNESEEFLNSALNFELTDLSPNLRHHYHSELNYLGALVNKTTPPPEA